MDANPQDLDLQSEVVNEFINGPAPAYQYVDLNDASFSTGFRSKEPASSIRDSLEGFVQKLPDSQLKKELLDPKVSLKELIQVIRYIDKAERVDFINQLIEASAHNEEAAEFLHDKLDNVLHCTPLVDRIEVVQNILAKPNTANCCQALEIIFRASEYLEELCKVVDGAGYDKLCSLENVAINEYLAHACLGKKFREGFFPEALDSEASIAEINQCLFDLQAAFAEVLKVCGEDQVLANTQVAWGFSFTAVEDEMALEKCLENFKGERAEIIELLNTHLAAIELEFKYGVNISDWPTKMLWRAYYQPQDKDPEEAPLPEYQDVQWSKKNIEDIRTVLETLPEGDLLFTKLLQELVLVPNFDKDGNILGVRMPGGVIQIAQCALTSKNMSKKFGNLSPLVVTLTHEIGHGVHYGDETTGIDWSDPKNPKLPEGEAIHDFDEWIEKCGWEIISRDRYKLTKNDHIILLDDIPHILWTPIEHKGKNIVLVYHKRYDLLLSYDANADFSSRAYARTAPWEDYAEAFAEYFLLPERLIADAPEKFKHLEEEFKKYEGNEEIKLLLKKALAELGHSKTKKEPIDFDEVARDDIYINGF